MSVFRNHKRSSDRSATDRSRHKRKIEEAIKEGIFDIVSDESIIGQDGKKKIKIPVRGIKEYRFVFGENNRRVSSAPGKDVKKGQVLKRKKGNQQSQSGNKPGNEKGEEFYEVEINLEELAHYLFDRLDLPDLERKKMQKILWEKRKRMGYKSEGIRTHLSKKETVKRKIRRKKRAEKLNTLDSEERFPFHQDDIRYKRYKTKKKSNSNAVIFFMMDVSGSMTKNKKFLARSFFFLLYHFLRYRYESVDLVFISHTTEAWEVSEDEFFTRGSSGGTYISSALEKTLDIIEKRYHPDAWNIYSFHCSDGDNWADDVKKSVELSRTLKRISQLYGFIEITPDERSGMFSTPGMSEMYRPLEDNTFKIIKLSCQEAIWPEFKRLFGGNIDV